MNFKTTPFQHQLDAFNKTADFIYAAYFMEPGTGKTKIAIDRSVHLYQQRKIDVAIVVCPKSLIETWEEEIQAHCSIESAKIAVWDSRLRRKDVASLEAVIHAPPNEFGFLIINIEALRTQKGSKITHWLARHKRVHIICDESSTIKTPSAKQTTAAINLSKLCTARTIMNGLPVDKSAADYYSQLNFLMDNPLNFTNYYSFRAHYCILEQKTINLRRAIRQKNGKFTKTRKIIQIVGPKNSTELVSKLLPFSVFVKKKDCLDLPDKIYHKRYCELTGKGKGLYKSVKEKIITEITKDRFLTTEIQLTKLLRLQQVVGGFLPSDDDIYATAIPGSNPKIELLLETLDQFPGPTLIWARFKAEHQAIRKLLESITTPSRIGEITGQIKKDQREIYRRAFQAGEMDYLICTQQCAGYGYTLTAAENEIYYSNTFSLSHRLQSEDRAHRIGQTKNVNIIDLLMKDTVDIKVFMALRSKKNVADLLTDTTSLEELI